MTNTLIDLDARFMNLACDRLYAPARVGRAWLDILATLYGEQHRHYHTLEHVAALLQGLDERGADETRVDRRVAELAIWFHDAIYQPGAPDNEERSAQLLRAFYVTADGWHKWPAGVAEEALEIIALTKHAPVPAGYRMTPRGRVEDTRDLVLDLDLAGLARPSDTFEKLQALVMAEFPNGNRWSRVKFLAGMLERPQIFRTLEDLEAPARKNIARHLVEVAAASPPGE